MRERKSKTTYAHVLKYTGVFGGVQGLKMLVAVLRNKLTALFLGGTGLGLIAVYNSISEFAVNASNLGLPLNATRQTSELYDEGDEAAVAHLVSVIRTWILWTALLSVVICTALSPLVSYLFFDHQYNRFTDVMMVIPIVVSFLVAEGECAILKGVRRLRNVALIEVLVALATLFLTVPFYYFLGIKGVLLGLTCSGLASVCTHFYFSLKIYPYRVNLFSRQIFCEGLPMIKVGIPYVLAGVANAGLNMAIPSLILASGTLADLAYYRVGFMLMAGYAGIAFVALEADYYPRLSAAQHDKEKMNTAINRQIEVCVHLITPFLILFIMLMPWIIPLLYEAEFLVALDMTVCACFYTFLRAIMLPVSYTSLAKGDSVFFLVMEVLSDVVFAFLIWVLYMRLGLMGAGIALSLWAVYDLVSVLVVYGWRYGCRVYARTYAGCVFQFIWLFCAMLACMQDNLLLKFAVAGTMFFCSLVYSGRLLKKKFLRKD